jgi:hypothetical protein
MTSRGKIALLLRGHLRDTLQNDVMRHFVHIMQHDERIDVDVYVQTWENDEASVDCSWRSLNHQRTRVSAERVDTYLRCKSHLRIIPEDNLPLVGSSDGRVGGTSKRGWKQMWLGIHTLVDEIHQSGVAYDAVLSLRIDFFGSYVSGRHHSDYGRDITPEYVREWAATSVHTRRICFLHDHPSLGIDNCYIGPVGLVHTLCVRFHFELDETRALVGDEWNQEKMVYKLAMLLNAGHVP